MHGMFFAFPETFKRTNTAGIAPIGSHLRYIPDFTEWQGKVVLATNETSMQGNPLAGQSQSNLWFGDFSELRKWGPGTGYKADRETTVIVEIDYDHNGWTPYKRFSLRPNEPIEHTFPPAFSAHWIRLRSEDDCIATAWLEYE